jgi:hypothetical protein
MQLNQHANLLSIFAWIMAGIQFIFVLLFGLYVLFTGGVAIAMALDPSVKDAGGPIMMGILALVFGIFTLMGLACAISNIIFGKRLRNPNPPSQRFVIVASIINIVGMCFAGIFSVALGVYGLWFALSDAGKLYFSVQGQLPSPGYAPYDAGYARDPNRVNWR